MYTKQEASLIRKEFWTSFGLYMKPLPSVSGEKVNWLNYKTGVKDLYFRMDANKDQASIAIELQHTDPNTRLDYFQRLIPLKDLLNRQLGETWVWEPHTVNEEGRPISRIGTTRSSVNIFQKSDWPAIISFLKPRIIALDEFWDSAKELF